MIAQAILSLLLSGVLVYAWAEYRRSPVVASLSPAMVNAGDGAFVLTISGTNLGGR